MAELGAPRLVFDHGCPDPGRREVDLPAPLPEIGDDFDWSLGDYDSFREAMLAELALRYPERRWWTSADLEVVLLEAFAAVLDQFSDMADRVAAESFLETARRPESVLNWLNFIGLGLERLLLDSGLDVDRILATGGAAPGGTGIVDPGSGGQTPEERMTRALLDHWRADPPAMETARRAGPGTIRTQKRMASLRDYALRLEEHPLVHRAQANRRWSGSWSVVWVTVSLWNDMELKDSILKQKDGRLLISDTARLDTDRFHVERELPEPYWAEDVEDDRERKADTLVDVLYKYVEPYRSIGQEVFLADVEPVGVDLAFRLTLRPNYFQSEVRREARRVLGRGPGGFFEPGRLKFGEDLHVSDFYERLMGLDGVDIVEALTFKKVGNRFPNEATSGLLVLLPQEVAVCDDDYFRRERGTLKIELSGGRRG